jgi:Txe/YoeB family toxin of toxin-antitoxin system
MSRGSRLVKWTLIYTSQARRDAKKVARSGLKPQAERLLEILAKDPYQTSPPYERLLGDLAGACSRRINIQHRLVYQVPDDIKTVKVLRMWTHYE